MTRDLDTLASKLSGVLDVDADTIRPHLAAFITAITAPKVRPSTAKEWDDTLTGHYFDYLGDVLSEEIITKVSNAMTDHTWHGAGNRTEATLQHGVRVLVELVRAEAEAAAKEQAEEKHRSLKAHYHALEESSKKSYREQLARLAKDVGRFTKGYQYTWDLLLKHRAKRSTFVRLDDLGKTMGMPLGDDNWLKEREPEPVEQDVYRGRPAVEKAS